MWNQRVNQEGDLKKKKRLNKNFFKRKKYDALFWHLSVHADRAHIFKKC